MHAGDQLMNAEVIKLLAEQTIELHNEVHRLEYRIELLEAK